MAMPMTLWVLALGLPKISNGLRKRWEQRQKTVAFLGGGGGVGGVSVAKTTALNLPATGYTIMGWVKSTNFSATTPPNTYFTLIGSQGINGQQEDAFGVGYGPQGLSFQTSGLDNYPSFDPGYRAFKFVKTTDFASDVLQPDKWHFVAVTYDGTAFRDFVDGVQLTALTSSTSWDALAPKSTARTTGIGMQPEGVVGGYDPANNGYISDVRLYNRGLSASEVSQLYASETHLPGTVVAWGFNVAGQTNPPAGLSGVIAIAADGDHTVALKSDGTVVAWGKNNYGQTNVPPGLTGVTAIAAGFDHTVALKADGTVVAWGRNDYGQTNVPAGLTGVIAITAGDDHTVALKNDGTIVGWGSNEFGQTAVPAGLNGLVIAISAGDAHTVALKNDGTVVAWGDNYFGRVNVPAGLTGVTAISAAFDHTLALKNDGTVVAWGNNDSGQKNVPVGLTGVVAVAAGFDHSVALKADGTVVAWGKNDNGQTTAPAGLSRVVAIAAGGFHTVALVAPLITSHPQTQTVTVGGNVTLSVTATVTGTAPFSYQWQLNGVNLAGATNSTLTLTNLTFSKAGSYRVVVTDFYGSATSDTARLNFVGLSLYPILTIADAVGSAYRIEVTSDLVNTNVWTTLTNFTLPSSPFDFIDKSTPQPLRRFYRAVPLP